MARKGKGIPAGPGARIVQLRKRDKLSQEELAAILYTSRASVNMWERGERSLKAEDVLQLADLFGVTTDYILRGIEAQNVDIYRATGLSQDAIDNLRWFKEKDLIVGTNESAGKCAALSKALASSSLIELVVTMLMLKGSKPGLLDTMMPKRSEPDDPLTEGDFYEGILSHEMYAAALSHRLYLTLESIRKGESGELPVYEPYDREKERTIEELRKSGRLIEKKGDRDGTPTEQR